jgi:3-oxoacyl-[acyl-carrier protein] reductase
MNYTLAVNLTAAFVCIQEFFRRIKGRPGRIINVASTAGTRAQPGWAAYAAAKAGLINLSLTLGEELEPYGIGVWCIAPGRCATELRRKLAPDEDQNLIMRPEEVASFIEVLLSGVGHLVDRQVIVVRR